MYGELPLIKTADGQEVPGYPVEIRNPHKTAVLRLPTNEEVLAWYNAQKWVTRTLGRSQTENQDVATPTADQKLFRAIRIDRDGEEFDDAEALYAIRAILLHNSVSLERNGQSVAATVRTQWGDTIHHLLMPTQKDVMEYERSIMRTRDLGRGVQETRIMMDVAVKLYDRVIEKSEGYAPNVEVPPHHKRAAILDLMLSLRELDPSLDPN